MLAKLSDVRISAQKARLVADQIRGLQVEQALNLLRFSPKKAAGSFVKLLRSAIANAEHNHGADIDRLSVRSVMVGEAARLKRMRPRAKGRGNRIVRQNCHISILVDY